MKSLKFGRSQVNRIFLLIRFKGTGGAEDGRSFKPITGRTSYQKKKPESQGWQEKVDEENSAEYPAEVIAGQPTRPAVRSAPRSQFRCVGLKPRDVPGAGDAEYNSFEEIE